MSRHDTDQEQLAQLKAWWDKWGTWLLSIILIIVLSFSGWRYWQSYKLSQASTASTTFDMLAVSQQVGEFGEVLREARRLMQDYPASPYAAAAALMLGTYYMEQGDFEQAQAALTWVGTSRVDQVFKDVAALRQTKIFINLQQYEQAQEVLSSITKSNLTEVSIAQYDYHQALLHMHQGEVLQAISAFEKVMSNSAVSADLSNLARLYRDDLAQ